MNKFGLFVVLLLLAGLCFPTIAVSSYETNQDDYRPGSSGTVTLTISNPDDYDVTGLSTTIYNPSEITPSTFSHISDISSGGTIVMAIPFRVKEDAAAGIYLFTVRFTGYSQDPQAERMQQSAVSVPITVLRAPELSIMMADATELSGLTNATLSVINDGGPARRVELSIDPSWGITIMSESEYMAGGISGVAEVTYSGRTYIRTNLPVTLYGKSKISLGDIADGKEINVMLDSRAAEDGPIDIPFLLEYDDELGNPHEETAYLRTTVENEILDVYFVQKSDIVTREESDLSLEIVNRGEDDLSDVRISFLDDSVRLKEGEEIKVGDVQGDEGSKSISERIFCELPPGLNSVAAKITWVEENVRKEQEMDIPLTILSDADVGVYLESKPAPLTSGVEHTISVLVSNLGSYRISNVEVELESEVFTSLDVSNTQYIGGLDADDFSTVQFKVRMDSVAEGDYPATVRVKYRDQSGEWVTRTLTENLTVYGGQAEDLPNGYLFLAVILVVVAAAWFLFLRKRKG